MALRISLLDFSLVRVISIKWVLFCVLRDLFDHPFDINYVLYECVGIFFLQAVECKFTLHLASFLQLSCLSLDYSSFFPLLIS